MASFFPNDLYQSISKKLTSIYDSNESEAISLMLLGSKFGLSKTDVILNVEQQTQSDELSCVEHCVERLLKNEPIQHILEEAEFYGRMFKVSRNVLIPRQETELLIRFIVQEHLQSQNLRILDIGTGSGCIAISLALELSQPNLFAVDVDQEALNIALINTDKLDAKVKFNILDILLDDIPLNNLDIVVSNPPYVLESEKQYMHDNVIDFDPQLALFVPDNDPLIFYRKISESSKKTLRPGGKLYFEINERFGEEIKDLLEGLEYSDVKIHKDLNGKNRFVEACHE